MVVILSQSNWKHLSRLYILGKFGLQLVSDSRAVNTHKEGNHTHHLSFLASYHQQGKHKREKERVNLRGGEYTHTQIDQQTNIR